MCAVDTDSEMKAGADELVLHLTPSSRLSTTPCLVGLVGKGELDPYSSLYIIPNNSPHNPFPHSLLSTRETNEASGSLCPARWAARAR